MWDKAECYGRPKTNSSFQNLKCNWTIFFYILCVVHTKRSATVKPAVVFLRALSIEPLATYHELKIWAI